MKSLLKPRNGYRNGKGARRPRLVRATPFRRSRVAAPRPEEPVDEVKVEHPVEGTKTDDVARGDSLQLYLREIGKVKLLTAAEEIDLARRIKRGDKEAREHMIKANLRLVVKIARDYEGLGVPLLDLISEGNIGLIKGVERFNPKKGAKLSTYASLWIKQQIRRALANPGKTIRLPVHVVERLSEMRKAEARLREAFDREPTDEELAHELELDVKRVRRYRDASRAPISLDAPVGDDDSSVVSEIVADPNAAQPFDRLRLESDTALVREVLSTLNERERSILSLRFGLDGGREKTLEEVGAHFALTRERIRQIQELALKKLRTRMDNRDRPRREEGDALAVAA
jgi:RNA polymerase primary sigma factor